MFTKFLAGTCLIALAACATAPTAPGAAKQPLAAATNGPPAGCVNGTGTRLRVQPTDCVGFGSAYSKSDVDKTGKQPVQQSLSMMDPTVRISGSL